MHAEHATHRWAVYDTASRSSPARSKTRPFCSSHALVVSLISVFLAVTTLPRFGTVWHTHSHGHTAHTHAHLSAASPPHHHDDRGFQSLPFGGQYARPDAHAHRHPDQADTASQHAYVGWTATDRHAHLYAIDLPPGAVVILSFALSLCGLSSAPLSALSRWSTTLFGHQPRAPPL